MGLSDKNIREKNFHDKLQSGKQRFENNFYKALFNLSEDFFSLLKNRCKDKVVLDFGCGIGSSASRVIKNDPRRLNGIDISSVSIEKAKKNVIDEKSVCTFRVDNCEKTSFQDNEFDLIYGTGVLHHLELEKCLNEINRILKKDGEIIFIEPMGTNPFINLYRLLTPKSRSEDEHPFKKKDLNLIRNTFEDISVKYYGFFTILFLPFYKNPDSSTLYNVLASIDNFIFKMNFLRFLAWSVLITAKKS